MIEIDKTTLVEIDPNRVDKFHRGGVSRVFYKGDAPEVKETEHEKALAEIAQSKWNYYNEHFAPIENEFMKDVDSMGSEGSKDFVLGAASGATQSAFSGAESELNSSLEKAGVNPNSGKFKSSTSGLSDAKGKSLTKNMTASGIEQQDQSITGIRNVSMMGRGEATQAQQGLSDIASLSHREAVNDARSAFEDEKNTNYTLGSAVGMGARAYMDYDS